MSGSPSQILAAALMLGLVSGCSSQSPAAPQGEEITIGAVLPLTGSLAQEGQLVQEGYLLWQDWINGRGGLTVGGSRHRIRIAIEDDRSRASLSGEATERLISQDGIRLLLGPYGTAATEQGAARAEQHQIPMVEANADQEAIFNKQYRYLFSVLGPATQRLKAIVDLALTLEPTPESAAILYASDSLSSAVAAAGREYALTRGLDVVYFGRYPSGTNTLRTQLAAAGKSNPDLLLESGHEGEAMLTMRQARELSVQPRLFAFTDGPNSERFVGSLQRDAEYVFGVSPWSSLTRSRSSGFLSNPDYISRYVARFGHPPDWHSAAATAACLALSEAVQRAGSTDPQLVRDALAALDLTTFLGRLRFDDRGANVDKVMYVEQVQNGRRVLVWPPDVATGRPKYPAPAWDLR